MLFHQSFFLKHHHFLRSFVEVIAPGQKIPSPVCQAPESKGLQTATSGGGPQPRQPRTEQTSGLGSRAALEQPADDREVEVEELGLDSEEDQQDQKNPLDSGDLAAQITVRRPAPDTNTSSNGSNRS